MDKEKERDWKGNIDSAKHYGFGVPSAIFSWEIYSLIRLGM